MIPFHSLLKYLTFIHIFQMLDSLSGKSIDVPLQELCPYGIIHLCMAMMVSLDGQLLMRSPELVIVRLYEIVEKASAG